MTAQISHRVLIALLAVYTGAVSLLILVLALMVAGYGETGTADALALAVPFIVLLATLGLAIYLITARLLRRGRHDAVMAWLFGYACLPLPVMGAMLY